MNKPHIVKGSPIDSQDDKTEFKKGDLVVVRSRFFGEITSASFQKDISSLGIYIKEIDPVYDSWLHLIYCQTSGRFEEFFPEQFNLYI
ncbi:MAG TPA: hypothetical protein VMW36_05420 [Patescibacteria group bacterium]|nr:hypothetical protein [Patescibacteria group bacterium]